ncbi:adenylate/guanylate cyclase domain-containing protein [Altererythrobacter sp. Root672]|uniref:adenylate/guanylate cyclase domain-containing protein n=1 Tax=Altererythrobacter sp. Root672 TaxID=1736584 RepID=UPI0012E3D47E|nr:adenylate/guanylate cyclase domain-containing protein [Altererythrobacter sp. Root672]
MKVDGMRAWVSRMGWGVQQPGVFSRFADSETEERYSATARALRMPFVRLYCVIFMIVSLAYLITNPNLVSQAQNAELAIYLGASLAVAGGYICVTFWDAYVRHPIIDFIALLLLSLLVGRANYVLFEYLAGADAGLHVVAVINRLVLAAFAAVTLAGRPRLFVIWLVADMLAWFGSALNDLDQPAFIFAALSYFGGSAVMFAICLAVGRTSRSAFILADGLDNERRKNEELVHNMLPPAAVQRIRDGRVVADSYADASVIFIDMVGFSMLARRISPGHLVELLNSFFNQADNLAAVHHIEKVKTVGDSYLAIAGGNIESVNSADSAIAFARAVIGCVHELRQVAGVDTVGLRVGIHSGPVVGGVIGATRMAYDYWGDTVNIAARLQGAAPFNGIAISESTWLRARSRDDFGTPETMTLKGVGDLTVYHASIGPGEGEATVEPVAA